MTAALRAQAVWRSFEEVQALRGVDLELHSGTVHALIGPNGAGKTTFLRLCTGLVAPERGQLEVLGLDAGSDSIEVRRHIGFFPSGDRSFYLRLSGLENLSFFARLHGLSRREALAAARTAMAQVDLEAAVDQRVGTYSHGMQKRLSVARALVLEPPVLLVDEATHDLDPVAAKTVRHLVTAAAGRGAAVLWTTQRLDELRNFADVVTVLTSGEVRYHGSVPGLMSLADVGSYLLRTGGELTDVPMLPRALDAVLRPEPDLGPDYLRLTLGPEGRLGEVITRLETDGIPVHGCAETRSSIEEAFLGLTGPGSHPADAKAHP
jgi:ABC-2 type transport system ATP-binding protein